MLGYCYLTRVGINLSFTTVALVPMLSYYTELFLYDNNNNNIHNKLPLTTITFRIIDGTIRFNNAKIHTHALGSICVQRDDI